MLQASNFCSSIYIFFRCKQRYDMLLLKSKRAKLKPHLPIHLLIYSLSIVNHLLGTQSTKTLKTLLYPITCVGDAFTDSLIRRSGSHVYTLYLTPTPPSQPCSSFSFSHLNKWQRHFSTCSSPKPGDSLDSSLCLTSR